MSDPALTARLLAHRAPMHASLSPDGARLLLSTTEVPLGTTEEVVRASVVDVATGDERPVPAMGTDGHSAVWAPDGVALAWITAQDGVDVVAWSASVDGAAQVLPGSERAGSPPQWSPDGTSIAVAARRGDVLDRSLPYRWTRPILAFDGLGPLEDPPQLRIVDVASGAARWLSDDGWRWGAPRWSPDGSRLAAPVSLDPEGQLTGTHLRIVTRDGEPVPHEVPAGRSIVPAWLPDGRLAVLVAEPRTAPLGGAAALFLVAPDGTTRIDRPHLFGDVYGDNPALLPETYEHTLLSDGTGRLVVRTGARGSMGVAVFDPDRPEAFGVVADGARCCTPVAAAGDTVVFTTQSTSTWPEVAVRAAHDTDERLLTSFGAGITTAQVQRFEVTTAEGWPLDGWFHAPAGARGPVPTVLLIHGGPQFTFGETFQIDVQVLTDAGFGVLFTNPRGSTGYGDEFSFAVHGDWAHGPTRDVLQVLDEAVARGWADGDRLAVSGLSYGGYLSAWLAATTTRFRAAVIENPVTDLVSMYATSDIGVGFFPAHFGGAPHEAIDTYRDQSPLLHAHGCATPCLFVVGETDRRCPPSQAFSMHRVLRHVGTPSEVLVLPGSSHEGSTYGPVPGRLAANDAMVEWLTRWV